MYIPRLENVSCFPIGTKLSSPYLWVKCPTEKSWLMWRNLAKKAQDMIAMVLVSNTMLSWRGQPCINYSTRFRLTSEPCFRVFQDGEALWYSDNYFLPWGKALPGWHSTSWTFKDTWPLCKLFLSKWMLEGGICHGSHWPRRNLPW